MQEVSLKSILNDQKVAAVFFNKVLAEDYSLNMNKYKDFNPKDFFDPNNKLSKLPHEEKLNIIKYHLKAKNFYSLWNPGEVLFENNPVLFDDPEKQKAAYNVCLRAFISQKAEIDKIIDSLPDEYHTELDIFFTELMCSSLGISITSGEKSFYYGAFLKYLQDQLKLAEDQNWPSEKKAVIQKWIAYCNEKLSPKPKYGFQKSEFQTMFYLLIDFSDIESNKLGLSGFKGILDAKFKNRSVIVNDNGLSVLKGWFEPMKYKNEQLLSHKIQLVLELIRKLCFDNILNSPERLTDLYFGKGYFEYVPIEVRAKIAATTPTKQIKTLADWYKFISQIESDKRNSEMDAAFLSSLPKKEFNYNLYGVIDLIVDEKELESQTPLQSEQNYSDEEKNSLDTEADTKSTTEIDENKVDESYKKQDSIIKLSPVIKEKEENEDKPNWFIRLICFIARVFGIKMAFGYCTETLKRIVYKYPAHESIKQMTAGKKKKKLTPVYTNTYTRQKPIAKAKNIKHGKNVIPKARFSEQKNISL